jgi:hypothetical protein
MFAFEVPSMVQPHTFLIRYTVGRGRDFPWEARRRTVRLGLDSSLTCLASPIHPDGSHYLGFSFLPALPANPHLFHCSRLRPIGPSATML